MAGCTAKEIMDEQKEAFGDNALKRTAVFQIVKRVKEGADLTYNRGKFDHKFMRTEELVEEFTRLFRSIIVLTLQHWPIISWSSIYRTIHKIVTDAMTPSLSNLVTGD